MSEGKIVSTEMEQDEEQEPVTLEALARLDAGAGLQQINAGVEILTNLRRASIALTDPEDWLLFKRPDGRITAYLSDDGCYRIDPIWLIDVLPPGGADKFTFEEIKDGEDFAFTVSGNGFCKRTGGQAIGVEGVRRSDEDFVKDKKGIQKKIEVRKAAFANLHGGIVRKLTGLKGLAKTELDSVWQGTNKSSDHCAQGRGFGSMAERLGQDKNEYGEAPECPACKAKGINIRLVFRPGKDGREPFWGCKNWKDCGQKPITAKKVATPTPAPAAAESQREPGDDSAQSGGETLPDKKNRLLAALRANEKISQSRRQELTKAISAAKKPEELIDVESALNE